MFIIVNNIMIAIITASVIASVVLGYFTLTRYKSSKREFFVLFVFCVVVYEIGYLFEMTATTTDGGLIATKLIYMVGMLISPLFLIFTQRYCEKKLHFLINSAIFITAGFVILLVWTSDSHTLYYTDYWYNDAALVHHLNVKPGLFYRFGIAHPMLVSVVSIVFLILEIRASGRQRRKRLYIFIYAALTPIVSNMLYVLNIYDYGITYTPVFFIISITILYVGLIKYDMLENEDTIRAETWLRDAMILQADTDKKYREDIEILCHDMRHEMGVIMELFRTGKDSEAEDVYSDWQSSVAKAIPETLCAEPMLNAALSWFNHRAEHKNVRLYVNSDISDTLPIDTIKLSVMVSNALENALAAADKVQEPNKRTIRVKLIQNGGQIGLEVTNPCADPVEFDSKGLPITKEAGHGIGVRSITAFAKDNGYLLDFSALDGKFTMRLVMGPVN